MNVKQFIQILATVTAVLLMASYAVAQGNGGGHGNGGGGGGGGGGNGGGPQYVTVDLNPNPVAGLGSDALGVNNANIVVGYTWIFGGGSENVTAVAWTLGAGNAVVEHALPGGTAARAKGINEAGEIVGGQDLGDGTGLYWSSMFATPLVLLPATGDVASYAYSINDSGVIVGVSISSAGDGRPVAWRVDGTVWGPLVLAAEGEAFAVSTEDLLGTSIVVGDDTGSYVNGIPVSWTVQAEPGGGLSQIGGTTAIGSSAGNGSAMAVNEAGDVCGVFYPASSNNGRDAFRANFGGPIIILNPLTNKYHRAFARGINSQRQCVGDVYDDQKHQQRAVLWQPDGSAVVLSAMEYAFDINDVGAIVGIGHGPVRGDDMPHAYILLPQ